jgi:ABC-type dipeptide/oligopeptide/nickel transport system permease component
MRTYVIRRILLLIPVLVGLSLLVFSLTSLVGDRWTAYVTSPHPSQAQINGVIEKYHLNESIINQYGYWLNGIIHGDWGYSKSVSLPVTDAIAKFFPATFELTLVSILIGVFFGIWLGTITAVRKDKPIDHATRVISLSGVSIPIFVLGLVLMYVFYFQLHIAPQGDRISAYFDPTTAAALGGTPLHQYTGLFIVDSILNGSPAMLQDVLWHIALPAITLSFGTVAIITRIMRASMLEVFNQDYIKTARAKGLSEKVVIRKHARRNALIPTVTITGLAFGGLLGGAILTESIYNWPGIGRWSTKAITSQDPAGIMGFSLLVGFIYVISNLIVDLMYAYLDPRVKLE